MTRGIRFAAFPALLLVAAVVLLFAATDTHAVPPPFDPGGVVCLDDYGTPAECDGNPAPGASSDIRTTFCIAYSPDCTTLDNPIHDSNFGGIVAFTPSSVTVPPGGEVAIGGLAGQLTSRAQLGILGNTCSTVINVSFSLMNASVNTGDTIDQKPAGQPDSMEPLALDANQNNIPDGADKYPSYLNRLFGNAQPRARLFGTTNIQGNWIVLNFAFFEPGTRLVNPSLGEITFDPALGYPSVTVLQNPDPDVLPTAGAITDFCSPLSSTTVTLGQTLDNPCTPTAVSGANCPNLGDPIADRGYPLFPCEVQNVIDEDADAKINDGCPQVNNVSESGAQCDNATSDDAEDTQVNDGCPAVGAVGENGRIGGTCSGTNEGGCTFRVNPAAGGTVTFTTLAVSQRDADSDGLENGLDVCSLVANGEWDPRNADTVNDTDLDGLPNACDPKPQVPSEGSPAGCVSGYTGPDDDADCFSNRADNCPTTNQLKTGSPPPDPDTNPPELKDSDLDGVGDACDPSPAAPNGDNIAYCVKFGVAIGGAAGAVVGQKDPETGLGCAAVNVVAPSTAPESGVTTPTPGPGGSTTTPGSNTAAQSGVGGPGSAGIGSLSPTNAGFPVWAGVLAAIGGLGLLLSAGILRRAHARRRIR